MLQENVPGFCPLGVQVGAAHGSHQVTVLKVEKNHFQYQGSIVIIVRVVESEELLASAAVTHYLREILSSSSCRQQSPMSSE